jgi:hypothetical protein
MISAMRHRSRPAPDNLIFCPENILDHNIDVGKSTTNPLYKWHELCWPTKWTAILKLPDPDTISHLRWRPSAYHSNPALSASKACWESRSLELSRSKPIVIPPMPPFPVAGN